MRSGKKQEARDEPERAAGVPDLGTAEGVPTIQKAEHAGAGRIEQVLINRDYSIHRAIMVFFNAVFPAIAALMIMKR